ncbi:MAG: ABC transporter substrate-binding protein [Candidatus Dadabacteria bacterium]|nr:ABC transporter substrate-binding protein [Candidatus Dadabacteria bacterium]NIS08554.1 ABC transporter substrate-binding protein [Candidatus Dadabacteria bacterium]NIV41382.1 ABC transporter substrate-binding protein [Candidatus Dadabacteria bacterium]NIX14589.1 ABC transporter substrate-binding protein [Candidatus Dadabacteria bacterium]NIY21044.1 ABC transporter substrate-binding protein [Candidatus Dadabacteria bacterium]
MKLFTTSYIYFLILLFLAPTLNLFADNSYPRRVVSLSPSITEIIYGLGAGDKVVGVTMYSDFPPEVKDIQKIGGWVNPNLEMILNLKPDLVIMLTDQDKIFGDKIRALGLKTLAVDSNPSTSHITRSISIIGSELGRKEQSSKLNKEINSVITEIQSEIANITPKKVLCVIGRNPGTLDDIYAVGNTSYINELITLSGGVNVIKKERTALKISKESIFALDPDIIIEINHDKTDKEKEVKEIWSALSEAKAIENNQLKIISSSAILHPSQRIVDGLKELVKIIHPEV